MILCMLETRGSPCILKIHLQSKQEQKIQEFSIMDVTFSPHRVTQRKLLPFTSRLLYNSVVNAWLSFFITKIRKTMDHISYIRCIQYSSSKITSNGSRISQTMANPWIWGKSLLFGKMFAKNCMETRSHLNRMPDRHEWKHYPPATSLGGCNERN